MYVFNAPGIQTVYNLTVKQLWLGGSFAVDIIIALTMIFIVRSFFVTCNCKVSLINLQFSQARRESISRRTDVLLKRLIVNTVETGAITAVTAGADLILYLANKDNYLHLLPYVTATDLFISGMLISRFRSLLLGKL